jgi:DNA-binding Lrp family transcriptional regulator
MPMCYVLVSTEPGHAESIFEALKKMDAVKEAHMVYGTFDIVAKVETKDMGQLKNHIIRMRLLDKVRSTQTMVAVEKT